MSRNYTDNTTPQKGMVQDVHPNVQPDGTYRFALNAVSITTEGEQGFLGNEEGNSACYTIPEGYYIIGHIPLVDNKVVLFLVNDDNTLSEIGIGDNFCNYTTVINSDCLGFTKEEQIQGTYSIVNGCETVIYFRCPTMRAINITNVEQYLLAGETTTSANADGEGWDCDLMKQFPAYERPIVDTITVSDVGGDLPLGTYNVITTYLDKSLNSIGWFDFTQSIPVTDESFSGTFENVDGGFNADLPPTNKSITVTWSNIDTSYSYLRIAIVASNDEIRSGYLIYDLPISDTTLTYTITSIATAVELDLTDFSVSPVIYEEAQTVTQVNNRLLYGNLKGKDIDHASFQQNANAITATWFTDQQDSDVITGENYKSTDTYVLTRGYMRDEVYAFGIIYLFKDGYTTPVYHIPGREKNTGHGGYYVANVLPSNFGVNIHNRPDPIDGWDDTEYTVTNSYSPTATEVFVGDVDHLGLVAGDTVERWEVFNTAIKQTSADHYSEGELAYWESDLDYPDTVDCNGSRIYPTGKIRFHKMPDTTLTTHSDLDDKIYPLGMRFDNITIPADYADQVTGYMIVRVKRDFNNSSVIDKGLFTRILTDDEILFQTYPYNSQRDGSVGNPEMHYQGIHTPKTKFQQSALGASYIKFEKVIYDGAVDYFASGTGSPARYRSRCRLAAVEDGSNPSTINTNRKINLQAFVDTDTLLDNVFGDFLFDNSEMQEAFIVNLDTNVDDFTGVPLAGLANGDAVHFNYGSLKKYLPQQYGNITSLIYIPTESSFTPFNPADTKEVFGGDCFISILHFRRTARIEAGLPINDDEGGDYVERHLIQFYTESIINCGYRNEGELDTQVYFPKSYATDSDKFINLELWTSEDPTDTDNELLDVIPNYYDYNFDFSQENDLKIYIPLSSTFDFCSTCQEEFPTRVIYSEVKQIEGTSDAFRIFLPNNYIDILQNKGDITNLFVQDDHLYAHLENSLVGLITSPQEIQTDATTTYLGTGAFLSLEPEELKKVKEGYLGSKSQWATCTTEYGTFFVSKDKMFILQDGLIEISDVGMRQFFIDNKLKFGDSFRELLLSLSSTSVIEFPHLDNPANIHGVGYISTFDRDKRRVILHKRDYKILFGLGSVENPVGYWGTKNTLITYIQGSIVYNSDTGWFEQAGVVIEVNGTSTQMFIELDFNDADLFENVSYTISLDPATKTWTSFHSYLPNYLFNTYDKWYSFDANYPDIIYQHNQEEFQLFYGEYKQHIIELVIIENLASSSVTKSIAYVSQVKQFNSTYNQWFDVPFITFNKVWLYNSSQSSNILDVVVSNNNSNPFISTVYSTTSVLAFKAENTWRFNRFTDYVTTTNIPFISNSWTDTQSNYYIDKVPNTLAHDNTRSFYTYPKIRDKFVVVRLVYDREEVVTNYKFLTQYLFGNQKYSNR